MTLHIPSQTSFEASVNQALNEADKIETLRRLIIISISISTSLVGNEIGTALFAVQANANRFLVENRGVQFSQLTDVQK